jgi:ferredoxin/flavodoxin
MNPEIYFFSSTGNSYLIARDLAAKTNGKLIPIASLLDQKTISITADVIGIVFPVYFTRTPVIIEEFADKLKNTGGKYIFAVCNYGGGTGDSLKILDEKLNMHGGRLFAKYGIHMTQNAFKKFWEKPLVLNRNMAKKVDAIVRNISRRKNGTFFFNIVMYLLLSPFRGLFISLTKNSLAKMSGLSPEDSLDRLIRHSDKTYRVNEKCDGCGICERICPVKNIRMVNSRPVWQNHCEACIGCYNWCPNRAISGGVAKQGYFYRNPEVKMADLIIRK